MNLLQIIVVTVLMYIVYSTINIIRKRSKGKKELLSLFL
jgi:hypothetical protein